MRRAERGNRGDRELIGALVHLMPGVALDPMPAHVVLAERGLGVRSGRYAMVVDDGVVKTLNVEEGPGKAEVSGADNLLKGL